MLLENKKIISFKKEISVKELWDSIKNEVYEIEIETYTVGTTYNLYKINNYKVNRIASNFFKLDYLSFHYNSNGVNITWEFPLNSIAKRSDDGFILINRLDGDEYFVSFFKRERIVV